MNTPIVDFLRSYTEQNAVRLHMPGHKGKISVPTDYDITEIAGADFLFSPSGIIAKSEENAAILFDTAKTLYSTEGSSLCIKTMVALLKKVGINKLLSARNSHISFINACALLGTEVCWLYPNGKLSDISVGEYTAEDIDKALAATGCKAVYLTSPDYLGNMLDIGAISAVCKKHRAYLLIDNAHGAYLKFTKKDNHPITLGADMCCDSAHKTLPVLTGGAYLHISKDTLQKFSELSKSVMSVLATTSPSYLIMASLDSVNNYLSCGKESFVKAEQKTDALKRYLHSLGFVDISKEPFKITVDTARSGISSEDLVKCLEQSGIKSEYADKSAVVLMLSTMNTDEDFDRIFAAFKSTARFLGKSDSRKFDFTLTPLKTKMSISKAFFANSEDIPTENAIGRICSETKTVCPPCVPIIVSGEVFDENSLKILKRYGIFTVSVVK